MELLSSSSILLLGLIAAGFAAAVLVLWFRRTSPRAVMAPLVAVCLVAHVIVVMGVMGVLPARYFDLGHYAPLTLPAQGTTLDGAMIERLGVAIRAGRLSPAELVRALDAGPPGVSSPPQLLWLVDRPIEEGKLPDAYADTVAQWVAARLQAAPGGRWSQTEGLGSLLAHPGLSDGAFQTLVSAMNAARATMPSHEQRTTGEALFVALVSGRCTEGQSADILESLRPAEFQLTRPGGTERPGELLEVRAARDSFTTAAGLASTIMLEASLVPGELRGRAASLDMGYPFGAPAAAYLRAPDQPGDYRVEIEVTRELTVERIRAILSANPDYWLRLRADLRRFKPVRTVSKVSLPFTVANAAPAAPATVSDRESHDKLKAAVHPSLRGSWIESTDGGLVGRQELRVNAPDVGGVLDVLWKFDDGEVLLGTICIWPRQSGMLTAVGPLRQVSGGPKVLILRPNADLALGTAGLSPCYLGEDIELEPQVYRR